MNKNHAKWRFARLMVIWIGAKTPMPCKLSRKILQTDTKTSPRFKIILHARLPHTLMFPHQLPLL
jgi:hypothetical protein